MASQRGPGQQSRPASVLRTVAQPLQAATNTFGRDRVTNSERSRKAPPPVVTAPRVHPAPPRPQQQRPTTRLEREKKRNYNDPPAVGPWKLGKLIGQGASGRVRSAEHIRTHQPAAVKIIPKQLLFNSRMSLRDLSAKQDKFTLGIEREIVIMKLIEHPNLLGLWDVYETSKELYLVMEYVAGGELFDHLVARGRLRPHEARLFFRQVIFGVDYCHSFSICHRDLKPENLLLDGSKEVVKIADFGMAALQPSERMLETSCGSPHYASPEIVSGKSYDGTASDIWSCGIILFALLCGRLPFDDPNIQVLLSKVRTGRFEMPEHLEPSVRNLIWRMLTVDPSRRATMEEIMHHPWFTDNGRLSSSNPVHTEFGALSDNPISLAEIDPDILGNLSTLWPELSHEHLIRMLLKTGQNWQKTFYQLLVMHRENHASDEEEEEDDELEELDDEDKSVLGQAPPQPQQAVFPPVESPIRPPVQQPLPASLAPAALSTPAAPSVSPAGNIPPALVSALNVAPSLPPVERAPQPAAPSTPQRSVPSPTAESSGAKSPSPADQDPKLGLFVDGQDTSITPPQSTVPPAPWSEEKPALEPVLEEQEVTHSHVEYSIPSVHMASPADTPRRDSEASTPSDSRMRRKPVPVVEEEHIQSSSVSPPPVSPIADMMSFEAMKRKEETTPPPRERESRFFPGVAGKALAMMRKPSLVSLGGRSRSSSIQSEERLNAQGDPRHSVLSERFRAFSNKADIVQEKSAQKHVANAQETVRPVAGTEPQQGIKPTESLPAIANIMSDVPRDPIRTVETPKADVHNNTAEMNRPARTPTPASSQAPVPAPAPAVTPIKTPAPALNQSPAPALTPAPAVSPTNTPTKAPVPAASPEENPAPVAVSPPAPVSSAASAPAPVVAQAPTPVAAPSPAPAPVVAPSPAPAVSPVKAPVSVPGPAVTQTPIPEPSVTPSDVIPTRTAGSGHTSEPLSSAGPRATAPEPVSVPPPMPRPTFTTAPLRAPAPVRTASPAPKLSAPAPIPMGPVLASRIPGAPPPRQPPRFAVPSTQENVRFGSVAPRSAVNTTRINSNSTRHSSAGSDVLIRDFMREIADELDSLDEIGDSLSPAPWPEHSAPMQRVSHDTAQKPSGAWVEPPRAQTSLDFAPGPKWTTQPRVPTARATGLTQFDDADEGSLIVADSPDLNNRDSTSTPLYAAFARFPSVPAEPEDYVPQRVAPAPPRTVTPGRNVGSRVAQVPLVENSDAHTIERPPSVQSNRPPRIGITERPASALSNERAASLFAPGELRPSSVLTHHTRDAAPTPTIRPASSMGQGRPTSSMSQRPASTLSYARPASSLSRASGRPQSVMASYLSPDAAQVSDMPVPPAPQPQLKRRRSLLDHFKRTDENAPVRPSSPSPVDGVSAKNSWFNGLLNRRSTQVLMSVENLTSTVDTCHKLLSELGATLTPSSHAHSKLPIYQQGALNYVLEQLRDPRDGTSVRCKPMRFRVEYTILPVASGAATARQLPMPLAELAPAGRPQSRFEARGVRPTSPATPTFATSVTFTHDKGSVTTFKLFMTTLSRSWTCDEHS